MLISKWELLRPWRRPIGYIIPLKDTISKTESQLMAMKILSLYKDFVLNSAGDIKNNLQIKSLNKMTSIPTPSLRYMNSGLFHDNLLLIYLVSSKGAGKIVWFLWKLTNSEFKWIANTNGIKASFSPISCIQVILLQENIQPQFVS